VGSSALSVMPGAQFHIRQLIGELDSKRRGGNSFTVVNRMLRSNEEMHVVDFILGEMSAGTTSIRNEREVTAADLVIE
jgi:hypothetical protein